MTKMSLYDVAMEGMQIEDILVANEGELTPELEERLDSLLREGPKRIEAAAMVVRGLEASAKACKEEQTRLGDRAKSLENQASRLKDRITIALDAAFNGKVKTDLFTIWAQSSAETVSFDLAPEFTIDMLYEDRPGVVRVEKSLDKKKLGELHKLGELLPEAVVVVSNPGTRYCRIK